jgi:hypothetical protein
MWATIGAALAALGALAALVRALRPGGAAFDAAGYGMTRRSHLRFALLSALFCGAFLFAAFVPSVPVLPIVAVYVLSLVLYASSFARGFMED